jgi:hypothetical protein
MAWAVLAGMAASTAWKAYSEHKAGSAAKKLGEAQGDAADSEAQLSDYNAAVAELQAGDAVTRGTQQENRFRVGVRGMVASQRAGFAGNGVDVGFGSAVDVQADAAYLGEIDALQIRSNAAREAWGYKVQAEDFRRRGVIQRKEGKNARLAGKIAGSAANAEAFGTVLGGTTSLLQAKYGMKDK